MKLPSWTDREYAQFLDCYSWGANLNDGKWVDTTFPARAKEIRTILSTGWVPGRTPGNLYEIAVQELGRPLIRKILDAWRASYLYNFSNIGLGNPPPIPLYDLTLTPAVMNRGNLVGAGQLQFIGTTFDNTKFTDCHELRMRDCKGNIELGNTSIVVSNSDLIVKLGPSDQEVFLRDGKYQLFGNAIQMPILMTRSARIWMGQTPIPYTIGAEHTGFEYRETARVAESTFHDCGWRYNREARFIATNCKFVRCNFRDTDLSEFENCELIDCRGTGFLPDGYTKNKGKIS